MDENIISLPPISDGEDKSAPLKNRIRKNYRHLRKWAKRTLTNCFRIYDRDIKEYPLAIDYYDGRFCVHFFTSTRETDDAPIELEEEITNTLTSLFNVDPNMIYWRTRKRRERTEQYEKVQKTEEFFIVYEHGVKFWVNLLDYLDTGLFLDHRETRQIVASQSKDKRVLNLFAYTCSFSVHAALKGAKFTKSVDLSNTYTDWGAENFALNDISLKNNEIVRADCLKFLDEEQDKYDIIVIDPPTLSRSKKMDGLFDIQEDYISLLSKGLKLLSKEGTLFFSTNARKFVFDASYFPEHSIIEITEKTFPIDFHKKKIHRCWKITTLH